MSRILITGANGFLGRHLVQAFLDRGHTVRALVRPAARLSEFHWPEEVEIVRADLRAARNLPDLLTDVDAVVHLAAAVTGTEEEQFLSTVGGTERLLDAMAQSTVRRLILASSFSVYDWSKISGTLNEDSPLEAGDDLYARDGYAIAKVWQEKIVRRAAQKNHWDLTVLRPGFIWGRGNEYLACLGQKFGRYHLTIGPFTHLPLTHVTNCADAFAAATLDPRAIGQTFNIIDSDEITTSEYFSSYRRAQAQSKIKTQNSKIISLPIPYHLFLAATYAAQWTSKKIFHGKGKLPSLLVPCRFEARFKPLRYDNSRLRATLNWKPPHGYQECLRMTYQPMETPHAPPVPVLV